MINGAAIETVAVESTDLAAILEARKQLGLGEHEPASLGKKALAHFDEVGAAAFLQANRAMLAGFVAALLRWLTEAIPAYVTSLVLIVSLVLLKVLPEETAYAQLGHNVMWLNILSFILSSMLVATGVAKRFALWFLLRFGRSATSIFIAAVRDSWSGSSSPCRQSAGSSSPPCRSWR